MAVNVMGNIMTRYAVLVFAFLLPVCGVQAVEPKGYEMPRTEVVPIKDARFDRQYELYIKLPEDYSKNTDRRYPVIYTTDADWHMEMLAGATAYLMPDVILVGISWQTDLGQGAETGNEGGMAHASRFRDYSVIPSSNAEHQAKYQFGHAADHLPFVRDDVIQYVESHYRADPSERTYFGYSLGGVFGAYILVAAPDTFKNYILGSPAFNSRSVEYLDGLAAKMAEGQQRVGANVFVSIGELDNPGRIDAARELVPVLERGSEAGLSFAGLEIIEGSNHGTAFPETVLRSIKWLSQ